LRIQGIIAGMEPRQDRPGVAVVLSIHNPDLKLLARLLASIRAQEDARPSIFAVLDGGAMATDDGIAACLAGADVTRIALHRQNGVREAFAAGLRAALAAGEGSQDRVYAFADQDDVWHPRKLSLSIAALRDRQANLVHCDARVVAADGAVLAPSLHRYESRERAETLLDHLVLNCVTGMTAVLTAETARRTARLLEDKSSALLHDHVAAIAAAAAGKVLWIDRPLVDYIQHDNNLMGAIARSGRRLTGFAWAKDLAAYRAASLAGFIDRRQLALGLKREGVSLGEVAEMFQVDVPPGPWHLRWLYLKAAARYLRRGQTRRWLVCLRLLDGALQFRSAQRA
jgi:O-antigen biosynthesis protein